MEPKYLAKIGKTIRKYVDEMREAMIKANTEQKGHDNTRRALLETKE
jgi:hypothetical protein